MFFPSEELRQKFRAGLKTARDSEDPRDLRRLLEDFPLFGQGWTMLGSATNDPREAEVLMWKGLSLSPCKAEVYLSLAALLTSRDPSDATAKELRRLALWKLSYADEIPSFVANKFEQHLGADAWDPKTYRELAEAEDVVTAGLPRVPEVEDQLRPYRLLNEIQRRESVELEKSTLDSILQHRDQCEPVLRNALREWAWSENALDDESAAMLVAILGEISGPDFVDDLIELQNVDDPMFLHVQWALYRQGLRDREAVMERFRKAAGGDFSTRAAIANQLLILPGVDGDVPVLESLLSGYEELDPNQGTMLLTAVAGALMQRNEAGLAKQLARRYGSALKDLNAEALQRVLGGRLISMLADEDIPSLDLEDVCLYGALMDAEEDEENEDLKEEWDEPVDLEPPRPSRNDPCWCGSGKKYKKCHLNGDEEADRKRGEAKVNDDLRASIVRRTIDMALTWHNSSSIRRAKEMFFGKGGEIEASEDELACFMEWLIFDFRDRATHRTALEHFQRTRGSELTAAGREVLGSMLQARFGLYELERVVKGSGTDVHDMFRDDRMFVHDVAMSHSAKQWDCLLVRAEHTQGRWIFSGNGTSVPRNLLERLRAFIEDESRQAGQSPPDWVSVNSHSLRRTVRELGVENIRGIRVVDNEGEEVTFGEAEYAVSDEAALIEKFEALEELEATPPDEGGKRSFAWVQPMGRERRPLGNLEIGGGVLKAEAMSRTRLATLRGLVEFHGGSLVQHREERFTPVDEIKERVIRGKKQGPVEPPGEQERALIAEYLSQHYAQWPDDPLPALGGKTARQAVKSRAGKQQVLDLLRMMQNGEERKQAAGEPAYDFKIIRRELGLPEE